MTKFRDPVMIYIKIVVCMILGLVVMLILWELGVTELGLPSSFHSLRDVILEMSRSMS